MPGNKKGGHYLRSLNSSKGSDADSPSLNNRNQRATTPNSSHNTSSQSYREHDSETEDEDEYTDSQEDDVHSSYTTTRASPAAVTPSPKLPRRENRRGKASDSDTSPIPHQRSDPRRNVSGGSPSQRYERMYPDLSPMQKEQRPAASRPPKNQKTVPASYYSWMGLVGLVVLILSVFLVYGSRKFQLPRSPSFQGFVSKVDALQMSFKSQDKRTWKTIKSSVKHILNATDPEYPAVVLFAVQKDQHAAASCLARRVASLFNHLTSSVEDDGYMDARLFSHLDARVQKENLDDKIRAQFKTGRSVVIDHLEGLSPTASLLLHGICDNDNAPFKNVFIGIVFYVDRELNVREVDLELEKYFKSELDPDKIGALLTRINNNAVVVRKEEGDISSLCS